MKRFNIGQIVLLTVALMIVGNVVGFLLSNPGYVLPIMRWDEPVTDEPFSVEVEHPHAIAVLCTNMQPQYSPDGGRWQHNGAEFITNKGYCFEA